MAALSEPVVSPRHERRRKSRALTAAARVGVVCVGLLLLWRISLLALSLGPFPLGQVQVVGSGQLPRAAVLHIAGVREGQNIFRIPVRAIQRRLQAHPAVERARLHRALPGTLRIELTERPAAAVINERGGRLFVDWKGRTFDCPGCTADGLAELAGVATDGLTRRSLAGPLAALEALKDAGVRCKRMEVAPSGGLRATVAGDILVKLGLPEKLAEKAVKTRQALAGLPAKEVEYLDVSCPTAIVWKSRDGGDSAGR